MKSRRATTSNAMASSVTVPLSRVLVHVRGKVLLARIDAGVAEEQLSGAVVVGGGREGMRGAAKLLGDLQIPVGARGVGKRQLAEELIRRAVGIVRVDAEEGDLPSALIGEGLEPGELEAA